MTCNGGVRQVGSQSVSQSGSQSFSHYSRFFTNVPVPIPLSVVPNQYSRFTSRFIFDIGAVSLIVVFNQYHCHIQHHGCISSTYQPINIVVLPVD